MGCRAFRPSDFASIERIYTLSKLDELKYETKKFTLLALKHDQLRLDQLLASDIYVYENSEVVGYAAHCDNEIRALFVTPSARGLGIGKQLFSYVLSQIDTESCSLFVAASNLPAKKLYSDYGFEVTDTFETSYNGVAVMANKMSR